MSRRFLAITLIISRVQLWFFFKSSKDDRADINKSIRELRKIKKPFDIESFSFKKVSFNLSARGLGSYIEILNEWTLDDYELFLQTLIEEKNNG